MIIERKKGGRPTKMPAVEVLASLYKEHTATEIARKYGVSEMTVRGWLRKARKESER